MDRSELMSRIRSTETGLERSVRKRLWSMGLWGYRKNWKKVPGRPDIAWPRIRLAIFLDGCFWHGCPWHFRTPKTNRAFWMNKIKTNKERDKKVDRELRKLGWLVIRFWEHESIEKIVNTIKEQKAIYPYSHKLARKPK